MAYTINIFQQTKINFIYIQIYLYNLIAEEAIKFTFTDVYVLLNKLTKELLLLIVCFIQILGRLLHFQLIFDVGKLQILFVFLMQF